MKVGILTFHSSYNFGANLQTLAIQAAVEKAGAEPMVINYRDLAKMEAYRNITDPQQVSEHERFIATYLKTSEPLTTALQIEAVCRDELDVVLVGSDQVFRLISPANLRKGVRRMLKRNANPLSEEATKIPPPYWLDWNASGSASTVRTASIAASVGSSSYRFLYPGLSKRLSQCLAQFDTVTVRDRWTEKMIKRLTGGRINPDYCPDPVFSLTDNFKFPDDELPVSDLSNTILISVVMDSDWVADFAEEAHRHGYQVASLPNPDREFLMGAVDFNVHLPLSPLNWFQLLSTAAGFVGIRYHALVSCMANHTPVVAVDTTPRFSIGYQQKSRSFDLCRRAGIPLRYVGSARKLRKCSPKRLLQRLFDPGSQQKADRFAETARSRFQDTMRRVLSDPPR